MRLMVAAVMLLGVLGCQSQHPVAQSSTGLMGDFSPVGSYELKRRHNFVLPFDASVYIANPVNSLVTDQGVDINALFVSKLKEGFAQNFGNVYVGLNKERFKQALSSARQMGAQFLVFGYIERWTDIKPIQLKQCKESSEDECKGSEDMLSGEGRSKVAISIYESRSGKLVDLVTVRSQRGVAAYLYEDHQKPMERLVSAVVNSLSEKY